MLLHQLSSRTRPEIGGKHSLLHNQQTFTKTKLYARKQSIY